MELWNTTQLLSGWVKFIATVSVWTLTGNKKKGILAAKITKIYMPQANMLKFGKNYHTFLSLSLSKLVKVLLTTPNMHRRRSRKLGGPRKANETFYKWPR